MRYLLKRNDFLKGDDVKIENLNINEQIKSSSLINETFENDITWGGSLVGRLINSTLRVLKIYVKTARISVLPSQLRKALDDLLVLTRTDEEQQGKIETLKSQFLLEEIIKIVNSGDSVEKKVAILVGDGDDKNSGLVGSTIKTVESIENLDGKDELLKKLNAFLESLKEMRSNMGDLEETSDEDLEDTDGTSKEGETGDGTEKSPSNLVRLNLFKLFRSIRLINDALKLKKVSLEGEKTVKPITPEVGKEYTYTDKNGKKVQVKVIDIKNQRQPGEDGEFLTKDDIVDPKKKISPKVLIAQKNAKGEYGKGSIIAVVEPKVLSESIFNEELVGTGRGRGDQADSEIKKEEIPATNALKKVRAAFLQNEKLMKEAIAAMTKIQDDIKSKPEARKYLVEIMRQVVANEATEGKPLTYEELIKEDVSILKTEYAPIIKAISLIARVLLSFESDKGLLGALGELKKPVLEFIESYKIAKENLSKLGTEKKEIEKPKEGVQSKEEEKKESYRIYEADETTEDTQGQDEGQNEGDEGSKGEDKVKEAWRKEFTEEEETKYKVDKKSAKDIEKSVSGDTESEIDPKNPKQYDRILEIVRIFGKAYKMYAVDDIPSGRPGGAISLKTYREYEYIGKEEGTRPEWKEGQNPGFGPWAARVTYNKWVDSVDAILQDVKYRKILANSKFKNEGPNQKEGAGLTLFTFINDMLTEGGKYGTFRQRKRALLNQYFGAGGATIDGETGSGGPDEEPKIADEELGTPGEANFLKSSKSSYIFEDFSSAKILNYMNCFFRVKGKSDKGVYTFIIYINGKPKTSEVNDRSILVTKMHLSTSTTIKQSLVTMYMDEEIKKGIKLSKDIVFASNENVYIGVIEFENNNSRIFQVNNEMKIKFSKSTEVSTQPAKEVTIKVMSVDILGYTDEKTKKLVIMRRPKKQFKRPTNDKIQNLVVKIKEPKVLSNFGLNEKKK
jgi:hypothetical protein